MVAYSRGKPLRDFAVSIEDACKAIHISKGGFRKLTDEGFMKPMARAGFYRLGDIIDGYAEAVRVGRLAAPTERGNCPASAVAGPSTTLPIAA
ncbi:hypothetical protein D3C87_1896410 [compost metagenome]